MANRWWQFRDYQPGTMAAIAKLPRYIACPRVTKRPAFEFISNGIHPDNALAVFAFADDYSFGILQSGLHWLWFKERCSTLKADSRYTSDTVFDTFAWPQFAMGSAPPAPGAAGDALVVGPDAPRRSPAKVRREGAANDTRGACAPQIEKIRAVAVAARAPPTPR